MEEGLPPPVLSLDGLRDRGGLSPETCWAGSCRWTRLGNFFKDVSMIQKIHHDDGLLSTIPLRKSPARPLRRGPGPHTKNGNRKLIK